MPDRKTNPIKTRNRVLGKSNPFPSLPMGGNTGEVLVKISDESGEVDWGVVQGDGSIAPPPPDLTPLLDRLDAIEAWIAGRPDSTWGDAANPFGGF